MKSLYKILVFILSLLFFCCFSFHNSAAQNDKTANNSLLWEISGNNIRKSSYLFGTIHMICQNDLIITEKIKKAFAKSKLLLLELNTHDPELELDMLKFSLMPDTLELKDLMKEEDYFLISDFFTDSLGMPITILKKLKPMIATSMLAESLMDCALASYEMTFTQMADKKGLKVKGLESIKDQFEVIDKISLEEQAQELIEAVLDYSLAREEIMELVDAYVNEDLDQIYRLVKDQFAEMDDYEDVFLVKRNLSWIAEIERNIKKRSCFIAVGAAHLVGEKGLLNLLKDKGYSVVPVN